MSESLIEYKSMNESVNIIKILITSNWKIDENEKCVKIALKTNLMKEIE